MTGSCEKNNRMISGYQIRQNVAFRQIHSFKVHMSFGIYHKHFQVLARKICTKLSDNKKKIQEAEAIIELVALEEVYIQ